MNGMFCSADNGDSRSQGACAKISGKTTGTSMQQYGRLVHVVFLSKLCFHQRAMQSGRQTRAYTERVTRLCTWEARCSSKGLSFETRLHHRSQNAHEVVILEGCCNTFLVRQLLIDFLCLTVGIFLNLHFHSITWG